MTARRKIGRRVLLAAPPLVGVLAPYVLVLLVGTLLAVMVPAALAAVAIEMLK